MTTPISKPFNDATPKTKGVKNPYAAPFTLLNEEEALEGWIGLTRRASEICMGFCPNVSEAETKAALRAVFTHKIFAFFATGAEAHPIGDPNDDIIKGCYERILEIKAEALAGPDSDFKTVLLDPDFSFPQLADIAKGLNGIWVHSDILNDHIKRSLGSVAEAQIDSKPILK